MLSKSFVFNCLITTHHRWFSCGQDWQIQFLSLLKYFASYNFGTTFFIEVRGGGIVLGYGFFLVGKVISTNSKLESVKMVNCCFLFAISKISSFSRYTRSQTAVIQPFNFSFYRIQTSFTILF